MKSLHSKLFFRYAALIFPIIVIFMVILYIILGNTLQKNATSELQADCDNISTLLDTQMEQIDELSKRIVSSDPLHSYLCLLYTSGSHSAHSPEMPGTRCLPGSVLPLYPPGAFPPGSSRL